MPADQTNTIPVKENPSGSGTITITQPKQKWEIKMAWSEYRNGKWTQKQVSKDAMYDNTYNDINQFTFIPYIDSSVPQASTVNIQVKINVISPLDSTKNTFKFTNNEITVDQESDVTEKSLEGFRINLEFNFQYDVAEIYSFQIPNSDAGFFDMNTNYNEDSKKINLEVLRNTVSNYFFHPRTHQLLCNLETGNLIDFFECIPNDPKDPISTKYVGHLKDIEMQHELFGGYGNSSNGGILYNELAAPYSIYNWELFFHAPMMLAGSLCNAQNFELAMQWYEYVLNPKASGPDSTRFWRFWPFQNTNASDSIENFFYSLQPNASSSQISTWRNSPFNPHAIARLRPSAYMKWTVMKYLDNLISWGDYLFTQHTISI